MKGLVLLTISLFIVSCESNQAYKASLAAPSSNIPTVDPTPVDLNKALREVLDQRASEEGKISHQYYILPSSDDFNSIPQDPNNFLSTAKVELGKLLFHETAIATLSFKENNVQTYSCSSCHNAQSGFTSGNIQAIAEGGEDSFGDRHPAAGVDEFFELDVQPLKTPSAVNGPWQKNLMWNGQFGATGKNIGTEDKWKEDTPLEINRLGFEGLETQAIAGLEVHKLLSESEPDFKLKFDASIIKTNSEYIKLFNQAFPNSSEKITQINAGLAIAAYERTILTNQAPFQKWLKGDLYAMNDQQKKGALLFFGKARCFECHTGPALNSMEFYALGMKDLKDRNDVVIKAGLDDNAPLGRASFTEKVEDEFKFKVPTLYNLRDHAAYGHGMSFKSVKDVIVYKNNAIIENDAVHVNQISEKFKQLNLSTAEINDLNAFVADGLHDDNLLRYVPFKLPSGLCFPNNDAVSINKYCN